MTAVGDDALSVLCATTVQPRFYLADPLRVLGTNWPLKSS